MRFVAPVLVAAVVASGAEAADLEDAKRALEVIREFADELCKSPSLEGSAQTIDLSASAKADLNNVLRRVADLGLEGATKYQSAEYQGVLQKDLAGIVHRAADCRLEVWRDLKDKLLPEENVESASVASRSGGSADANQVDLQGRSLEVRHSNERLVEAGELSERLRAFGMRVSLSEQVIIGGYNMSRDWPHSVDTPDGGSRIELRPITEWQDVKCDPHTLYFESSDSWRSTAALKGLLHKYGVREHLKFPPWSSHSSEFLVCLR